MGIAVQAFAHTIMFERYVELRNPVAATPSLLAADGYFYRCRKILDAHSARWLEADRELCATVEELVAYMSEVAACLLDEAAKARAFAAPIWIHFDGERGYELMPASSRRGSVYVTLDVPEGGLQPPPEGPLNVHQQVTGKDADVHPLLRRIRCVTQTQPARRTPWVLTVPRRCCCGRGAAGGRRLSLVRLAEELAEAFTELIEREERAGLEKYGDDPSSLEGWRRYRLAPLRHLRAAVYESCRQRVRSRRAGRGGQPAVDEQR